MEPAALEKGIDFRVDVTRAAVAAEVDSAMLRQIVLNLLSNAVKFTPYGEVSFTAAAPHARRKHPAPPSADRSTASPRPSKAASFDAPSTSP
jgi:hypothetical protein